MSRFFCGRSTERLGKAGEMTNKKELALVLHDLGQDGRLLDMALNPNGVFTDFDERSNYEITPRTQVF